MGTSGSYGGSNRQGWNRARQDVQRLVGSGDSGSGDAGAGGDPSNDEPASTVWQTIADALAGEDPLLAGPPTRGDTFSLSDLLPPQRPARRGGVGGAVVRGATVAAGRQGFRSARSVVRNAARGGAAIGGAYAFLRGDAAALGELGLDLQQLRGLSPRMQCARILEAVLGEGGHPDDAALQRAAAEELKAIILSGQPPGEIDALRGFVAHYVFELCLVELQRDITTGAIDSAQAARLEKRLRAYLEARIRLLDFPHDGPLPVPRFREAAAKLTQDAVAILRAGREAA
jgi:hypothetical protein